MPLYIPHTVGVAGRVFARHAPVSCKGVGAGSRHALRGARDSGSVRMLNFIRVLLGRRHHVTFAGVESDAIGDAAWLISALQIASASAPT